MPVILGWGGSCLDPPCAAAAVLLSLAASVNCEKVDSYCERWLMIKTTLRKLLSHM